jgi:3-phytase
MAAFDSSLDAVAEKRGFLDHNNGRIGSTVPRKTGRRSFAAALTLLLLTTMYLVNGYSNLRSRLTCFQHVGCDKIIPQQKCTTLGGGYQCFASVSHHWGMYSPYFSLASESSLSGDVPAGCQITFAQVLSRHGARYPTESKSSEYARLVSAIQAHASSFTGKYEFLRSYNYSLGSDDLTPFGEDQMIDSGMAFYQRYEALAAQTVPFIRASDSDRVVISGEKFIEGFQKAKDRDRNADRQQPCPDISVVIPEEIGFNNSLDHGSCPRFEDSELGKKIEDRWIATFVPPIQRRLSRDLPGVQLSWRDVVHLMDLCPFDTVSRTPDASEVSPFCALFSNDEWTQYDYLQSLSKYYGFGGGNPLGPTQGIGFANELIARLTRSPVHDDTSTNHTLDAPGALSFPLNATLYADFTHDNGMIPIFFALGLYNATAPLPTSYIESPAAAGGYSAAWTVPFGARAYIEMMQCSEEQVQDGDDHGFLDEEQEPLIRVLVNDRVVPLHGCSVDDLGRCRRSDFVRALSFAREGGNWDQCFA